MPRVSIVMATHNEGALLWKTVASCIQTCEGLDYEIVIADDASEDDCLEQLQGRFPGLPVFRSDARLGPSPAKDMGAQHAQGEILIFLDAHCKPERGALERLANDVDELDRAAVVTPSIVHLDTDSWKNSTESSGHGYLVELDGIQWKWIPREKMRPNGRFFESPSLIGCCCAVSRELYQHLWGFDRDMYMWGVEDVDFGVKSWLMGHPILHDPETVVGHRFQKTFTTYCAPGEHVNANRMRMAYKILPPSLWKAWLDSFRSQLSGEFWHRAWDTFTIRRGTAEAERVYLQQYSKHDVEWYARRFSLCWPRSSAIPD